MCRSFDDIMAEEEAEDQKIRQNARIALDRMSSDDKVFVCVCACMYVVCVHVCVLCDQCS